MIKYLKIMLALAGLGGMPAIAQAQWTIDECQRLASENYPLLKRYSLIEQSADYSIKSINTGYIPQLRMSGQATWQSDVTTLPEAFSNPSAEGLDKKQYCLALDLEQTLWDGGNKKARKEMVRAEKLTQQSQADVEMYAIRERVNNLFFGILLLEDKLRLNEDLQKLLLANSEKLENLYQNGAAMKADADAVRAEYLKVRQQHTELASSKESFTQMLALFIAKPASEITQLQKPDATTPVSDEVNRPEMQLLNAQLEKIDTQQKLLNSGIRPSFSLFAQGYWGYPGYDMFSDMFDRSPSWNAMVGVRMSWNIGKLYSHGQESRKLELTKSQVQNAQEIFLFNNRLQATEEHHAIRRYKELMKEDHEIIALRTAVRESAEAKLEHGIIDVNNLLQEIIKENEAKTNLSTHEIEMLKHIYELKHTVNQ